MTLQDDRDYLSQQCTGLEAELEEYIFRENVKHVREFAFEWAYQESRKKNVPDKFGDLFIVRKYEVYGIALKNLKKQPNPKCNMLKIRMDIEKFRDNYDREKR